MDYSYLGTVLIVTRNKSGMVTHILKPYILKSIKVSLDQVYAPGKSYLYEFPIMSL